MKIQFSTGEEFLRQFKRLSKKYKSLTTDIIARNFFEEIRRVVDANLLIF